MAHGTGQERRATRALRPRLPGDPAGRDEAGCLLPWGGSCLRRHRCSGTIHLDSGLIIAPVLLGE